MVKRLLTYLAAFIGAFAVWTAFSVLEVMDPSFAWRNPILIPFIGLTFPGGAGPGISFVNHVIETWFPFLIAWFIASRLSRGRARFRGALGLYAIFLVWSAALVLFALAGLAPETLWVIGLEGAFFGGAVLYLKLVDPQQGH